MSAPGPGATGGRGVSSKLSPLGTAGAVGMAARGVGVAGTALSGAGGMFVSFEPGSTPGLSTKGLGFVCDNSWFIMWPKSGKVES